ncbi:uncharacterized protein LACBIDRAFT_327329 [Laccaria bicolor S238N-H82]|uniref:Predicted protein n=1 Tax=Laccaria bicolor (strain S238N-H82 / ATCC MYA-4686) TaxID=486041 RepID=B0DAR1_LACBS|nr:uncharacterized protein LACBIDRAFT_327329 [Laccaria bicolor S238N-H82]EDR08258.1 predicted protein [Laccaria bicolor S238N-H82]|eukprot:XP_001881328.1 predicted protein [Laccaria bicolor S238N-H82]
MSHATHRLSQSISGGWREGISLSFVSPVDDEVGVWVASWRAVSARDLIDSRVVSVDAETSVEEACEVLMTENIPCLVIKSNSSDASGSNIYQGLFDVRACSDLIDSTALTERQYSDVNAFLTLAATRHTYLPDDLRGNARVDNIVAAAKAGRVPVHLVSNLSEKNQLETLPNDANIISLLETFAKGSHRVLIHSATEPGEFIGIISDRRVLSWFASYAKESPSFQKYLSNPIQLLSLPSLNLYSAVVAATSTASILDAMRLMSEEGVSSIAVIEENRGILLSAVSVTDIGKNNQILTTALHHFVSQIKELDGSTDGADRYPDIAGWFTVYSVSPSSTLSYTVEKLLATNAHRLFVTKESRAASPVLSSNASSNLSGIVSIVDSTVILCPTVFCHLISVVLPVLSLFARLANVPGVDPTHMQRHRRASSASSQSSKSERDLFLMGLSRSSSRSSVRRSPTIVASSPPTMPIPDSGRNAFPSLDVKRGESLRKKDSV